MEEVSANRAITRRITLAGQGPKENIEQEQDKPMIMDGYRAKLAKWELTRDTRGWQEADLQHGPRPISPNIELAEAAKAWDESVEKIGEAETIELLGPRPTEERYPHHNKLCREENDILRAETKAHRAAPAIPGPSEPPAGTQPVRVTKPMIGVPTPPPIAAPRPDHEDLGFEAAFAQLIGEAPPPPTEPTVDTIPPQMVPPVAVEETTGGGEFDDMLAMFGDAPQPASEHKTVQQPVRVPIQNGIERDPDFDFVGASPPVVTAKEEVHAAPPVEETAGGGEFDDMLAMFGDAPQPMFGHEPAQQPVRVPIELGVHPDQDADFLGSPADESADKQPEALAPEDAPPTPTPASYEAPHVPEDERPSIPSTSSRVPMVLMGIMLLAAFSVAIAVVVSVIRNHHRAPMTGVVAQHQPSAPRRAAPTVQPIRTPARSVPVPVIEERDTCVTEEDRNAYSNDVDRNHYQFSCRVNTPHPGRFYCSYTKAIRVTPASRRRGREICQNIITNCVTQSADGHAIFDNDCLARQPATPPGN